MSPKPKSLPFGCSKVLRTGATGSHLTPLGAGCNFVGFDEHMQWDRERGWLISTIITAARQISISNKADGVACAVRYCVALLVIAFICAMNGRIPRSIGEYIVTSDERHCHRGSHRYGSRISSNISNRTVPQPPIAHATGIQKAVADMHDKK